MDVEKWNSRMLSMRMYIGNSLSTNTTVFHQDSCNLGYTGIQRPY